MAGSWAPPTNAPPAQVATCFLLTDGTVLAQGVSTSQVAAQNLDRPQCAGTASQCPNMPCATAP